MSDNEHSAEEQEKDVLSSSPGTEPRLPWEVPSEGTERGDQSGEAESNATVSHFAQAGQIDVLTKIARLRLETEKAFHDRDALKGRVAELEKQCAKLQAEVTASKEHSDTLLEQQAKREEENRKHLAQIRELESRLKAVEAEKKELAAEVEAAKATLSEISSALDWAEKIAGAPPEDGHQ